MLHGQGVSELSFESFVEFLSSVISIELLLQNYRVTSFIHVLFVLLYHIVVDLLISQALWALFLFHSSFF
jgi:hypothetical protein